MMRNIDCKLDKLIIIGAGGHGKVCADIAKLMGYKEIVFLDDNPKLKHCGEYAVVGPTSFVSEVDGNIFVAVGDNAVRRKISNMFSADRIATLIHPDAVIADSVKIGRGTVIMAGTVINEDAQIGEGGIINTCSSVDHDCKVGDFVHIAVGCHVAGTVSIEEGCFLGAGSVVINNINIISNSKIGAGAVVVEDIKQSGVYVGIPAKMIGGGYKRLKHNELTYRRFAIICRLPYCAQLDLSA